MEDSPCQRKGFGCCAAGGRRRRPPATNAAGDAGRVGPDWVRHRQGLHVAGTSAGQPRTSPATRRYWSSRFCSSPWSRPSRPSCSSRFCSSSRTCSSSRRSLSLRASRLVRLRPIRPSCSMPVGSVASVRATGWRIARASPTIGARRPGAQGERRGFPGGDDEAGGGGVGVQVGQVVLVEFGHGVPGELVGVLRRAGEEDLVAGVRGQRQLGVAGQLGEVLVGQDQATGGSRGPRRACPRPTRPG